MSNRYDKLGIKQTIQKHWMDYVVNMMLAGLSEKEIRAELQEFLATQKQSGGIEKRGRETYGFAIPLLASWFSPAKELTPFRNHALELIRNENPVNWLPYHWAIISASYPFWFNVAKQTGRLFNLQDQITRSQVFSRLKEQYGDRETVARNARYVIRSFVAWGVLKDCKIRGCYEQNVKVRIHNSELAILLYEAALHTNTEGKATFGLLKNHPAFFPFQLPTLTGSFISQQSKAIEIFNYGVDEDLLKLKNF